MTHSRTGRRMVAIVATGVLTFTGAAAAVAETGVLAPTNPNKLAARGPVNTEIGFPAWYGDGTTRLELCLDPTNGLCGILPDMIPDTPDRPRFRTTSRRRTSTSSPVRPWTSNGGKAF